MSSKKRRLRLGSEEVFEGGDDGSPGVFPAAGAGSGAGDARISFTSLSDNVLVRIASHLSVAEVGALVVAAREYNALARSFDPLWGQCWSARMAKDPVQWFGSFKAALMYQRVYRDPPKTVGVAKVAPTPHMAGGPTGGTTSPLPATWTEDDPSDSEMLSSPTATVMRLARSRPIGVSCLIATPNLMVGIGFADGTVALNFLATKRQAHFSLGYGSVRHMQARGRDLFVASWRGTVHCVDLVSGSVRMMVADLPAPLHSIRMSIDRLFLSGGDASLCVYHLARSSAGVVEAATQVQVLAEHTAQITDFELGPTWLATCSYDRTVRVWEADIDGSLQCSKVLLGHRGPVWTLQLVGDSCVSGAADGTVRVWDRLTGTCTQCIQVVSLRQVWCLSVLGDSLFVGTSRGDVQCWTMSTGRQNWSIRVPRSREDGGVRRLVISSRCVFVITTHGDFVSFAFQRLGAVCGPAAVATLRDLPPFM